MVNRRTECRFQVRFGANVAQQIRYTFLMINHSTRRIAKVATICVAICATTWLSGCTSAEKQASTATSAESLYNRAKRALNQGDFLTAVNMFETLGARFPFGSYTQQAQLDIAYAYLKQDEFDNAIISADRFIKLYPRSDNVDYAIYIKGVANFSRGGSFMERVFPRDMAKVNQNWLRASFAEFDSLIRQYPDSEYVPDSLARMAFLRNEMARHELITAKFYYQRGAMVAVVNRVNFLLEHYDGSEHIPNALALMASAYGSMGQSDLQGDTLRVLAQTEPAHPALNN